ncbi:MAG TPA: helix-turn-helix transcriptional regulator [Solirubrobacterales bacterium]|nr:helix-turn-helix transcriptional regulator [Solirubrobacterales bacterium]
MPESDPQPALGQAVRALRQKAEMSQEALAARAELDPAAISRIEAGQVDPAWGDVRRIARGLDVPLEALAELAEELEGRELRP